jgi:alpha-mannosidase
LLLMAFKQAEDQSGFIFRTYDFSGVGGCFKLGLPKPAIEVISCDLVESNGRPQSGRGMNVAAPLKPFGPVTLKVLF